MLIPILRRTILLLAFVLLNFSFASAQDKKDITIYFEKDSVAVEKGSTFTNFLVIENKSSEAVTIQNIVPQENYPGLLFYPKNEFTLDAGQSKNLPVKLIANVDFMKLRSSEINFQVSYITSSLTRTESISFTVKKEENSNIAIYTEAFENFINPNAPDSSILLTVENQGYSKRNVKIDFQSIPDGLEMMPKQQTVFLEGLEKQTVEIKIVIRKHNTVFPEFNINAIATDLLTNEIVGSNTLHLLILSNNRQIARGPESVSGSNFAEMSYNENSSGFNFLQLRANTAFRVSENVKSRFNIGTDYFMERGLYNIYDTWLEMERKNTVLRVGNINSTDYEYPIFGRGAKISTKFGSNKQIELLALENNYNLYSTYFQQINGSNVVGAKYGYGNAKTLNGKISYIYDHDPRLNVDTQLANAVTSFSVGGKHTIRTEVGLSHEKGLVNKDENAGGLVGAIYEGRAGRWDLQSTNSFATKSYAGIKRGSFFSNQRIGRQFSDSKRAFIQYQNSQVDPGFLSLQNAPYQPEISTNLRYYFNSTESLATGYQFIGKNWNFLVSPKIEKQKTASFYTSHELFSYRLETNISTTLGNHSINLTAEYSYSNADNQSDWFNSLRTTLSYRYKSFSLNGTAQWNATNVFDLNSFYNTDRNFANYNVYASYNFHTLGNNLTGSFSAGAFYSELYKNLNTNITGNLEYRISPSWSGTGYFNLSGYKSMAEYSTVGSYYQFRVGIKKYFAPATALGNHKVTFQFFEDKNFNGLPDSGEKLFADEIVKLDDYIAMTDKNGKVVFQNVPEGIYTLKVNENAGARLMMDPVIMVSKNINRRVGLVKNIRVSGKLTEIKQAYDVLDTDVTGIAVYAKGEDGVIYTALVNQKNEFEFFLKDGKYEIYIENDRYSYTQPRQTIQVTKEGYSANVIFEYRKKDTTIKVKKF
ncbi:outer membrane beta-barrel family protein [Chryseobacterium sp. Leaf394]|uniref:COG1470 family protein n=1 Tax=Chryseobacterium sp. Leaf394 TaxID=1736361 RepID=UPI000B248B92|nr:outer membrane beta-barrel family protein [Chryseobacterium sp. Leaf394]